MSTAIVRQPKAEIVGIDAHWESKLDLIKRTVAEGATNDELALFLHQAKKTGLDPLAKQIYAIKRWNSKAGRETMTIQTGIDGYRLIADRTGQLAGIDDPIYDVEGSTHPNKATVAVYKMVGGIRSAFTASARWSEYVQTKKDGTSSGLWAKMPYLMLGKCAEALALRKAFPAELSGVYTNEEMSQADSERSAVAPKLANGEDTFPCERCHKGIEPTEIDGKAYTVGQIVAISRHRHEHDYCVPCLQEMKEQPEPVIEVEQPVQVADAVVEADPLFGVVDGEKRVSGTITGIYQINPKLKKPHVVKMHDEQFSTFSESLAGHLFDCAGERAILAYTETEKNGKTFKNITGIKKVGDVMFENNEPVKHGEELEF